MKLTVQKRLASRLLKVGQNKVKFDPERVNDIKEAITSADLRTLIKEGAVVKEKPKGVSKSRSRKVKLQKKKGRRKGHGSRKGKATARTEKKETWINRIRAQRKLLSSLKEKGKITKETYSLLYKKAKGGFFRSKRHLLLYLEEQNLIQKTETKETKKQEEKSKEEKQ